MARQKVPETLIHLENWQDADDALRTIGEHMRDIAAVENVMNEQIAAAKAAAEAKARPAKEQIALLETALRVYTTEHRDDLGKAKSKALNFGTVSFRKSTKVKLPTAVTKLKAIIDALRAKGMTDCINQPDPKVDKEALKKYPASEIIAVGASLVVDDVFGYDVDMERIQ